MKRNIKNIIIQNPLESFPIKSKPIIQTTIINSPKIISSKNHVIIKQYINTNEKEQPSKENYLYRRNIKTENKTNNFKKIFNDKQKLVYQKQGLNNNTNKNDSSLLNNTITIFNRNKGFLNSKKNNNINNNKTHYIKNNNLKIKEINIPNNKTNIESYNYLYLKQKKMSDNDNNTNKADKISKLFQNSNIKLEKKIKISKNSGLFSNEEMKSKTNRNINSDIIDYEIEKAKTFEKFGNKKFKKKRIFSNKNKDNTDIYDNNNINDYNNYENNDKTIKPNISEMNLYIKKYPFQKQAIKQTSSKKEYNIIKNSYSKLYNEINNITLENGKLKKISTLEPIKECDNNNNCKKIVLLNKQKNGENKLNTDYSQNQHNPFGEPLSSPYLDKEVNDNISDRYMTNQDCSIKKTNSLPKTSFRFLINRASKDKQFGDSFHKAYEINKNSSIGKKLEKIPNDNNENKNNNDYNDKNNNNEKKENIFPKNSKDSFFNKFFKEKRNTKNKNVLMNNLKVLKKNNIIKDKYINKENNENITHEKNQKNEKSNDDIKFSKTLNNFKNNSKSNNFIFNLMKNKSNDNILENQNDKIDIIEENIIPNEEANDFVIVSSVQSKKQPSFINIELFYNLENKILSLLNKIKKYKKFENESYDIINYYFKNDISKYIIELFNGVYYKNIIISYIKTELLSYFLCYDICFHNNYFEQIVVFIKSIINLIHNNFLLLLLFIIKENENNSINYKSNIKNKNIIYYLENIIKQNINQEIINNDINEGDIIKMLMKNVIEINKYYKIVIDNIYQSEYLNNNEIDNNLKFPYCLRYMNSKSIEILNTKKNIIISSFFIESYQLLNNYPVFDLENFFYSFLDKTNLKLLYQKNNQFILPKIDNTKFKYTLVLDLDQTLIHCDRKSNTSFLLLLRPGLIEFLEKMKNICELILFSFGTKNYVDSILKVIERKQKFFEYILDRSHGIYDNGDCIKNLDMLNRDLKNVIIIDDTSKYFKLHQENGICVKPFYGDIEADKNTLSNLGNILEKIFYDANISKDVRISLKKFKKLLTYSNIINN